MGKQDSVAARKSTFLSAQDQALVDFGGGCFDDGVASMPAVDADEQAKIDAAVKAAVEPLNAQIVDLQAQLKVSVDQDAKDAADSQAAKDALASVQGQVVDLQKQLDSSQGKLSADESVIKGFQGSIDQLKSLVSQLEAIILPPAQP